MGFNTMSYLKPISDSVCENLLCSEPIGSGSSRKVFLAKDDPSVVIKKASNGNPGTNFTEWFIWNAVKDTDLENLFGECLTISETGNFLIMEILNDIAHEDYKMIPELPIWIQDVQPTNIGKDKLGRYKIRDYAMVRIGEVLAKARREKAGWSIKSTTELIAESTARILEKIRDKEKKRSC